MDESIKKYIVDLELNEPSNELDLKNTQKAMNFIFPEDYQNFIQEANGAEGGIGDNSYLQLWSLQNIIKYNEGYEVNDFVPGLILIGSDGGNEAYAYDTRFENSPIVRVPFIIMNYNDVIKCADTFNDFLKYLYNQK